MPQEAANKPISRWQEGRLVRPSGPSADSASCCQLDRTRERITAAVPVRLISTTLVELHVAPDVKAGEQIAEPRVGGRPV